MKLNNNIIMNYSPKISMMSPWEKISIDARQELRFFSL